METMSALFKAILKTIVAVTSTIIILLTIICIINLYFDITNLDYVSALIYNGLFLFCNIATTTFYTIHYKK